MDESSSTAAEYSNAAYVILYNQPSVIPSNPIQSNPIQSNPFVSILRSGALRIHSALIGDRQSAIRNRQSLLIDDFEIVNRQSLLIDDFEIVNRQSAIGNRNPSQSLFALVALVMMTAAVSSANGDVIIPVRGNDIDDDDSNPVQGNDTGYVRNISSLFATCHGAILAVVALIMSAPVSSAVRIFILFISALVSVAIIRDLVVKSYKQFSAKRGQRPLRNSLVANLCWVTQRIVLFLIFIMLSLCLLLASNRMLRLHHH